MVNFVSCVGVCMLSHFSHIPLFVTPWTVAPAGSSVHGILQARILEWVAMPSSRGSSQPRERTLISCIAGGFSGQWTTWKDPVMCNLPQLGKKASHEVQMTCQGMGLYQDINLRGWGKRRHKAQITCKGMGLYQDINPRGWGLLRVACHPQSCIQSWQESMGSIRTESSVFKTT